MAFDIGSMGSRVGVGAFSPRGNNRGSVIQSSKGLGGGMGYGGAYSPGGLPMNENTYDESKLNADSQFELGMAPINFKRDVFDKTFPLIQGLAGSGNFNQSFGAVGGQNTPLPKLPNSFVYSPDQIQQQVNAARAQGDQGGLTQRQQTQANLTGRGFSTRSPLAMAMNQAADTGVRAQNQDAERQIRFGAAGQNANQDLQVGQLAEHAWNDFNQNDVARRTNQTNSILGQQRNLSSLIAALSGLG